jgi:hypothetical protein
MQSLVIHYRKKQITQTPTKKQQIMKEEKTRLQ